LVVVVYSSVNSALYAGAASRFLADSYFRQENYELALKTLGSVTKPDAQILFLKAKCLKALDRTDEAFLVFESLLSSFPGTIEADRSKTLVVEMLGEKKAYEKQVEVLLSFIKSSTDERETSRWSSNLAYVYLKTGEPEKGVSLLQETNNFRKLADLLREGKIYDEYMSRISKKEDRLSKRTRAELYLLSGNYSDSMIIFKALSENAVSDEEKVLFLERLVSCEEQLGDNRGLLDTLSVLSAMKPLNLLYQQKLGGAWYKTGNFEKAMSCWRKLVDVNPKEVNAWLSLASILEDFGLAEQQLNVLREGKAVTGASYLFIEEIFPILIAFQKYDEAVDEILGMIVSNMPEAEELTGKFVENDKAFSKIIVKRMKTAIERYPSIEEYYLFFDFVTTAAAVDESENEVLEKCLLEVFPRDDSLFFSVVGELVNRKRYKVVLPLLVSCIDKLKGDRLQMSLLQLAEVQIALLNYEEALKTVNSLFEINGLSPLVQRTAIMIKGNLLSSQLFHIGEARKFWALIVKNTADPVLKSLYILQGAKAAISALELDEADSLIQSIAQSAPSGLKSEILFVQGYLQLLRGNLIGGETLLASSVEEGGAGITSSRALELLLFIVAHKVAPSQSEEYVNAMNDSMTLFLQLKILLEVRDLAGYDRLSKTIVPSSIPLELLDEYLLIQADRALLAGDTEQELSALDKICKEIDFSPYKDSVLFRMALIYIDRSKDLDKARNVIEEHLLTYPDSIRAEEVRRMLRCIESQK
jgi:tetratricopeptide (TPR) repeat protein